MLLRNALGICLLFCLVPPAFADWPQWRGPDRLGSISTEPLIEALPAEGLAPEWMLDDLPGGNSGGWGSPVISGGRVFVFAHTREKTADPGEKKYPWLSPDKRVGMTDQEYDQYEIKRREEDERRAAAYQFEHRLVCLDLESGELIWEKTTPASYSRFTQSGTPCVIDGKVLVLGSARTAYCHDAATGKILWEQRLPGEFRDEFYASSFAAHDGIALVACGPLFALDATDGTVLWSGDEKQNFLSHSSPVVWDNDAAAVAICNTSGSRTIGYRLDDGKQLWELDSGVDRSSPMVVDNVLLTYGGSRKSGLSAYRLDSTQPNATPQPMWQFRGAADSGSTPVVSGDHVFVQGEKRLAKVSLKEGDRVWQTTMKVSNPRYTSPIVVGDQLLFAWQGILAFATDTADDELIYDAKIDSDSRLITEADLREKLNLDEIERSEGGRSKAEKLWQQKAVRSGPLQCSTPAFSDGRLVVRLNDAVACYDLRAAADSSNQP